MNSEALIKSYKAFLLLEKGLSSNSINAYLNDAGKLIEFCLLPDQNLDITRLRTSDLTDFLTMLSEIARIISGIRSFYKFMMLEQLVTTNPAELIELPKLAKKLPEVLSLDEIDKMMAAIDYSLPEGHRNRAILETLYGCGLRVSELVNLKFSNLYFHLELIKVIGKGDKERLVPINQSAIKYNQLYFDTVRRTNPIQKGFEDIVYLNRRGKNLSRVMVFYIIKDLAHKAGVVRDVSPHTFRHSFATHLYERGADLRVIQDMLGHSSITTTEIYSHVSTTYLKEVLSKYHPRFQ
jgi:integrase/recombinase XerD